MPNTGVAPIRPKTVGLPGFTAIPWKITSPICMQDVQDQVALADRAAAGEHDDVRFGGGSDCAHQFGQDVRRRRMRHGNAAVLADDRCRA